MKLLRSVVSFAKILQYNIGRYGINVHVIWGVRKINLFLVNRNLLFNCNNAKIFFFYSFIMCNFAAFYKKRFL